MAAFDIKGKVALITGGASGLGFTYALALLEKGAKAVTLADINPESGDHAVNEIETKYGKNRAIFVKTDITNYEQFEGQTTKAFSSKAYIKILVTTGDSGDPMAAPGMIKDALSTNMSPRSNPILCKDAFKKTVATFKNIDILINNAGILGDKIWPKEIAINVNGTINGMLLGLDIYLRKYKSGSEGVIVNVSSVAGVDPMAQSPVYVGTKFAVHGMTLSWGNPAHYSRTNVRVVGICPGITLTPLINGVSYLGPEYEEMAKNLRSNYSLQKPEQVAPSVMEIIEKAEKGTIWIVEGGEPPYQYKIPNRFEIPKLYLQ